MNVASPRRIFLQAWSNDLKRVFPDYSLRLFGAPPDGKDQCPRITIDFLGNGLRSSTGSRARRKTANLRIVVIFHKWISEIDSDESRQEMAFALLDEFDRNETLLVGSLQRFRLDGMPDGLALLGEGDITGVTFELPANCRDTVVTSIFTIQNLPLEFTSRED